MRFSELCSRAGFGAACRRGDAEVKRVVTDSRQVSEGDCFVAVRGASEDGHRYIASAVAAGCSAVVCEEAADVPGHLAHAVVADSRIAAGPLAQAILGWPCRKVSVTGITGTNGKTTVAHLLRRILQHAGKRAALLGTIRYETLADSAAAGVTTPGPVALAAMMNAAVQAGASHLVMEVSSHALDQRRAGGVDFDVGVFTNLSGDHLDYHGSMDDYLCAKRRLFESLSAGAVAVLNREDPYSESIASATAAPAVWYGLSGPADVHGRIDEMDVAGSVFSIGAGGLDRLVRTGLIGRHNVSNCLAATAAAGALGIGLDTAAAALEGVGPVPGRLQRVAGDVAFDVFVDYAHTDDALDKALSALRPMAAGKLILVFGCGGDRDRTKRPRMARVAQKWADAVVVTSDNPRREDPMAIIDEITAGFSGAGVSKVGVEPDRRSAIAAGIGLAGAGDVVLIAGKGHETYQVVGDERIHFDDVETAEDIIRQGR